MTEEQKLKLQQYADAKTKISELEAIVDDLKPQVLEMMGDNDAIETDFGTFNITKRRTWTYPGALVEREKQLKVDQKLSQQLGTATYTESPTLVYRQLNSKEENG